MTLASHDVRVLGWWIKPLTCCLREYQARPWLQIFFHHPTSLLPSYRRQCLLMSFRLPSSTRLLIRDLQVMLMLHCGWCRIELHIDKYSLFLNTPLAFTTTPLCPFLELADPGDFATFSALLELEAACTLFRVEIGTGHLEGV